MKKHITLLCMAHALLMPCFGQEFNFHSVSPFGIQTMREDSSGGAQKIMFFDFDQDEDLDLFLSGIDALVNIDDWDGIIYFLDLQENIGDKWNPQFAPRTSLTNFPFPLGYFFPTEGDVNNDGEVDFMANAIVDYIGNRTPTYVRNTGGSGNNEFEAIRFDSLGLPDFVPESFFIPELVDLDLDGDLDILMSGFDPAFGEEDGPDVPVYYYAKNVGTTTQPEFVGWYENPYGLMPNPLAEILTEGDIDNDGDMDFLGVALLIAPDSLHYLYVHLNTPGANLKPSFGTPLLSPYGLPVGFGEAQFAFPNLVDINSDGDLDLFVFQGNAEILELKYFENSLCEEITSELEVGLCPGDGYKLNGTTYTIPGVYSVTLQTSEGCDSIILLTISEIPMVEVVLHESICDGESIIIENEVFTAPGNYTILVSGIDGCDTLISLSLEVHFIDPTVNVEENILTATQSGATYQWFDCDTGEDIPGATAQFYVVLVTGNYGVDITDEFGCTVTSTCNMVVITGTIESTLVNKITIYPNPTEGKFNIKNESSFPLTDVSVTNMYGQRLSLSYDPGKPLDLGLFGKGVYFIRIKMDELEVIKKLVVF